MEETWEFAALVMSSRPAIPAAMKRAIQEEAGYRCAVPTCRDKGPFDFEHIDEWSKVNKHEFHNIVLLCVSCHARVTRKEIHKDAIRTYKRNLAITSGRYSIFEMRLLEIIYNMRGSPDRTVIILVRESELIHARGFIRDGLVGETEVSLISEHQKIVDSFVDIAARREDVDEDDMINIARQLTGAPKSMLIMTAEGRQFAIDYFEGRPVE